MAASTSRDLRMRPCARCVRSVCTGTNQAFRTFGWQTLRIPEKEHEGTQVGASRGGAGHAAHMEPRPPSA
eukprot:354857-Chlamydomonas_euryale.AAC.13